jgi:hypothetical protein
MVLLTSLRTYRAEDEPQTVAPVPPGRPGGFGGGGASVTKPDLF